MSTASKSRVWSGPVIEHGKPIELSVSLEGRWSKRQVDALRVVLQPELDAENSELYTVENTIHSDTTRWFLVKVREKGTGLIRPARIRF